MNIRKIYLLTTFLWSYCFWGIGIYISNSQNSPILGNENIILGILKGELEISQTSILISSLILLAAFGPLVGALIVYLKDLKARKRFFSLLNLHFNLKHLLQALILIFLISVLPIVAIGLATGEAIQVQSVGLLIPFFIFFLLFQILTSGTEEIGWRGYLLPSYLEEGMIMWEASKKVGFIWALWHFPILIYVFISQGLPLFATILFVVGFTAGTVGMSLIHTYFLIRSKSVFLSIIIHGLYNTIPLTLGLIMTGSTYAAVITQVGMWVVIAFIEKKEGKIFENPANLN
jgi:membrane protease YdiL (CAAX protease family)